MARAAGRQGGARGGARRKAAAGRTARAPVRAASRAAAPAPDASGPPAGPPVLDTRMRIVLAAMDLFWEKGFQSTSVADLLQRADVNAGSLYHFFPGKQDVLVAVLQTYRDGIRPMLLEPAWAGVADPVARVFALLSRYRGHVVDTACTYGCPIGSLALELHEPDPVVRELMAANFDAWVGAITECLEEAGERLPAALDRRALAEFTLTAMEGAVMQARTHRDVGHFDRSIAQLRAYYDCLLRAAAGAARPPARRGRGPRRGART